VEFIEQLRLIDRVPPHHRVRSRWPSAQQESLFDATFNGLLQHNLPWFLLDRS
jgi:hypothetical protein